MPEVSIIIPVYNKAEYLEKTVRLLLKNCISDIELILVDDGSLDGSGELPIGWQSRLMIMKSKSSIRKTRECLQQEIGGLLPHGENGYGLWMRTIFRMPGLLKKRWNKVNRNRLMFLQGILRR